MGQIVKSYLNELLFDGECDTTFENENATGLALNKDVTLVFISPNKNTRIIFFF